MESGTPRRAVDRQSQHQQPDHHRSEESRSGKVTGVQTCALPICKNRLQMEVYGTKSGVIWNQERPDELWIGNRNTNNQIIIKDPSLLKPLAKPRSEEHTSELQSLRHLVCRLLLE